MDIQYWLYIIIGIIYLINQFRKKPEQSPSDFPNASPEKPQKSFEQPNAKPAPQKAVTFEELLREISEGKGTCQADPVLQKHDYVDYDDDIDEEVKEVEEVNYDDRNRDTIYNTYEQAKREAFNRASLEETIQLADKEIKFGRFKEFDSQTQSNLLGDYLADLKDPEGLKKAVIMSEIFQRRF